MKKLYLCAALICSIPLHALTLAASKQRVMPSPESMLVKPRNPMATSAPHANTETFAGQEKTWAAGSPQSFDAHQELNTQFQELKQSLEAPVISTQATAAQPTALQPGLSAPAEGQQSGIAWEGRDMHKELGLQSHDLTQSLQAAPAAQSTMQPGLSAPASTQPNVEREGMDMHKVDTLDVIN